MKAVMNVIDSSASVSRFDALRCLLMAKVSLRMDYRIQNIFWATLPDRIPDLMAHLPALTVTVRNETDPDGLAKLSSHPVPTTLSPETVSWRLGPVRIWEKRLKATRDEMDGKSRIGTCRGWTDEYVYSLRGLTQMDRCGMPAGMTCPSLLPVLLNEARDVQKQVREMVLAGTLVHSLAQLVGLSTLANWRPAPNVMTAPAVLKMWGDLWLELYDHLEACQKDDKKQDEVIILILKGITAKALLNLLEAGDEHETGVPVGMETILLECLTTAAEVMMEAEMTGKIRGYHSQCHLLSWQPRDVSRFPTHKLAMFPKALLEKFRLWCQKPWMWGYGVLEGRLQSVVYGPLEELIRWDQSGLLAACGIDLLHEVVTKTDMMFRLEACMPHGETRWSEESENFLNRQICKWLIQKEMRYIEEGRQFLHKLERHWQLECRSEDTYWRSRNIAWEGRMMLQRAGLADEDPSDFCDELLKAISEVEAPEVQMVLSIWRLEKDMPGKKRRAWERLWKKKLKSCHEEVSLTAALSLLQPDPTDDLIAQREKLLDILTAMPEDVRPKLSIDDMTQLMVELPLVNRNAPPGVDSPSVNSNSGDSNRLDSNRGWQFKPEATRFRIPFCIPTERIAPVSTPETIQLAYPDRATQSIARGESHPGR